MTELANATPQTRKGRLAAFAIVFAISYLVLFLAMSRQTTIYEEGFVLAAAMRVAAGQIVHRDFYMNYGPAQFYALAAIFKLFGQSLLIERLYDLLLKSLVVTAVYAIAADYCRRSIAVATAAAALLWQLGLSSLTSSPVVPVCLLNLVGVAWILPTYERWVPKRRLVAAGGVAGLAFLFRYDTGIALLVLQIIVLASVAYWHSGSPRVPFLLEKAWPLAAGFAAVSVPCALCYLLFAPLHPIVFDILIYPAAHSGPRIPLLFPPATVNNLENVEIFLLVAIMAVALLAAVFPGFRSASGRLSGDDREMRRYRGFLFAFGLLVFAMYFTGIVHVGLGQIYLSIVPSLLLVALLLEHSSALRGLLRRTVLGFAVLSVIAATWSFLHEIRRLQIFHLSFEEELVRTLKGTIPPLEQAWCHIQSPMTRGLCFFADNDQLQTIEYVATHTSNKDKLYVELTGRDKITDNDDSIYFAADRLPATAWFHLDRELLNSVELQRQTIRELDVSAPPYIVLKAQAPEPNESFLSRGVLDQYLHSHYHPAATFGQMSVWQRDQDARN